MKNTIFQTPVCQLKELNNLFIELTEKKLQPTLQALLH